MTLSTGYALATDAQFRELGNFSTPPRAGRITALEGNGQVRVATDDPDGGDVLAWPLNGFSYAVNDVVYIAFAVNNPESAIVIGAKGTTPTLDAAALPEAYVPVDGSDPLTGDWDIGEDRRIKTEALRARDGEGLKLEDDAGNLGLFVQDGGYVGIGTSSPGARLHIPSDASHVEELIVGDDVSALAGLGLNGYTIVTIMDADNVPALMIGKSATRNFLFNWTGGADSSGYGVLESFGGSNNMAIQPNGGNIGIGMVAPQGKIHASDGTGRLLFVSKTGITGTAQTIIPNGAGDVTGALIGWFVLNDGTSGVTNSFTLLPGEHLDISVGGSTWRLALNVNGALTVVRQSGSGTASITLLMLWI